MYNLTYLPLAKNDLESIAFYIADKLQAPQTALDLLVALDTAISRLQHLPYSCKVYSTVKPMDSEYRFLQVKNFAGLYVVTETTVEIHRIIYAKKNKVPFLLK